MALVAGHWLDHFAHAQVAELERLLRVGPYASILCPKVLDHLALRIGEDGVRSIILGVPGHYFIN